MSVTVTQEMIAAAEAVDDLYRMGQPQLWARVFRAMYAAMPLSQQAQTAPVVPEVTSDMMNAGADAMREGMAMLNRGRSYQSVCKKIFEAMLSAAPSAPIQANGDAKELTFADALRIARGCTDYGGGHRGNDEHFQIYQHGIQTVINSLAAAEERGLADTQVQALHRMGSAATAQQKEGE